MAIFDQKEPDSPVVRAQRFLCGNSHRDGVGCRPRRRGRNGMVRTTTPSAFRIRRRNARHF